MSQNILFDEGWRFHLGEIERKRPPVKGPIYSSAKTERARWGAASMAYNDGLDDFREGVEFSSEKWEAVNLPHDYVISGEFSEDENNTLGYLPYGSAWYRKHFKLDDADKDKILTLHFEAIAMQSEIWVNGIRVKYNFSGYNSFDVEITDFVNFDGKDNVIAIHVTTAQHEGWWYEGAGIYRHVYLTKSAKVHVARWGVFVKPSPLSGDEWKLDIETEIRNASYEASDVRAVSVIRDAEGNEVASGETTVNIALRESTVAKYQAKIAKTHLWNTFDPYLYTCETTLYVNGEAVDTSSTRFGCRTYVCDPEKGLFINGIHTKIKGVCGHYDCGLLGKAVPDNIFRHKVRMMQEMGANGYRTSHYPQAVALMDAFDEAGFIVFDETRWFASDEDSMDAFRMLIKRDRNHPSVFFWSAGNEEIYFTKEQGRRIAHAMMAEGQKLDDTRKITLACSHPDNSTVFGDFDAIGINYGLKSFDEVHKKYPKTAIFSSENCATGTTRGWYFDDCPEQGYLNAMDKNTNAWFMAREATWKFIMERDYIMGGYQWIAFEHRGETVWPRLCSQSGAIDLFLQKKDAFWQNQSHWTDAPMVHLLPHWNWRGREGEPMVVRAYTNCPEVELFLDGASLGRVEVEPYGHADWTVEYKPGRLEVVAYKDGVDVARDVRETTGRAVKLALIADNADDITANGEDIALFTCVALDEAGREVPDAAPTVRFTASALGTLVATGSDICDHTPLSSRDRKMRAGRITVAVKLGKAHGTLRVYAECDGLDTGSCAVEI